VSGMWWFLVLAVLITQVLLQLQERFMNRTIMSASRRLHLMALGSNVSFYDTCNCCDT
jgi:hypothetical protein